MDRNIIICILKNPYIYYYRNMARKLWRDYVNHRAGIVKLWYSFSLFLFSFIPFSVVVVKLDKFMLPKSLSLLSRYDFHLLKPKEIVYFLMSRDFIFINNVILVLVAGFALSFKTSNTLFNMLKVYVHAILLLHKTLIYVLNE